MEQVFFVYLLTFANGKVYVGMSKTDARGRYDTRYRKHDYDARKGKQLPVYNAWRKHGAPEQSILSTHATRDEAALAEIAAIEARDSMNPAHGYNLVPGGGGMHAPVGSAVYELMRAKVWNNPERRRKSSEALKGKPLPESVLAAHKVWRESDAAKAQFREIAKRPGRRAKLSAVMRQRLDNGYREHLSAVQRGKPRNHTPEGTARIAAGRKAWANSPEGKAAARQTMAALRADPETEAKRLAALTTFLHSDDNLARCRAMGAAARKPVKDLNTDTVYGSQRAAAAAFGVAGPTIGYWIKKGKFAYV